MKVKAKLAKKNRNNRTHGVSPHTTNTALPFMSHLLELRRRLFYVAVSVLLWASLAYVGQRYIIALLLKPAHGQHFIYTSPIGGVDFLFRVCLYSGLIFSIPVIIYNMLRYVEPLLTRSSTKFIMYGSAASAILAIVGIFFGYMVGLPAALHFLLHQFLTSQIQPMLTIQSYMSFVMVYMVGSALLLQVPLILIFINRIKPLKPKPLLRAERWVIIGAFVMSGLMNPTPQIFDQLVVAGPLILMYQVGILIVLVTNRHDSRFKSLRIQDAKLQAERLERLKSVRSVWEDATLISDDPTTLIDRRDMSNTTSVRAAEYPHHGRSGKYLNDVIGQRRTYTRTRRDPEA